MEEAVTTEGRRSSRKLVVVAAVIGSTVIVLAAALLAWAMPSQDVSMPADNATPEEVVLAYMSAVNARDFETSDALWAPPEKTGRFSRVGTFDDVRILRTVDRGRRAHVMFTFTPHGITGFIDGIETSFGYYLKVNGAGQWRIVDAGAGG